MVDLDRTITYVKKYGTSLEEAQLTSVPHCILVPLVITTSFFADQHKDRS